MNAYQVARQLRYLLQDRTWGGTGDKVFSEVIVTPLDILMVLESAITLPICAIRVAGDRTHSDHPSLVDEQEFVVAVACDVPNDPHAMAAVIGAGRPDLDNSGERGVLEIEAEVRSVLGSLTGADGVRLAMKPSAAVDVGIYEGGQAVAWRSFGLVGPCQAQPYYHPCRALTATAAGSGVVNLAWKVPPDRWDRHSVILRRASGATPPASSTAGTGVTLASVLATSVADSPGAGTWSYSIFGAYDDNDDGTADHYSAALSRASVVAT